MKLREYKDRMLTSDVKGYSLPMQKAQPFISTMSPHRSASYLYTLFKKITDRMLAPDF